METARADSRVSGEQSKGGVGEQGRGQADTPHGCISLSSRGLVIIYYIPRVLSLQNIFRLSFVAFAALVVVVAFCAGIQPNLPQHVARRDALGKERKLSHIPSAATCLFTVI